jgi:hypothetical protein
MKEAKVRSLGYDSDQLHSESFVVMFGQIAATAWGRYFESEEFGH